MSEFATAMARAQARVEHLRAMAARRYSAKAAGAELPMGSGAGGLAFDDGRASGNAEAQIDHFRDWVFACVRAIAQRIAGQPIRVARVASKSGRRSAKQIISGRADLEPLDDHPLLDVLADPNEPMIGSTLLYVTVASLELTGRAHWWLRDGDGRKEIWPLPSHWVEPDHSAGLFSHFKVQPPGVASPFTVPAGEMAYFSYPDPKNPITGALSPLQATARAVVADKAIQGSQVAAFERGMFPGMAIIAGNTDGGNGGPPMLEKHQRQQIVNAIKTYHSGWWNAGEPLILDALIRDVKPLTNKPAEMDWLNSGKLTKSRIFQAFGVNPIVVGEIENANRAQAAVAESSFCANTLNPKISLLSQALTEWVGPAFAQPGEALAVWIEPAVANDDELTAKEWEAALRTGVVTRNEYRRERLGLPPLTGVDGDKPLMPVAYLTEAQAEAL